MKWTLKAFNQILDSYILGVPTSKVYVFEKKKGTQSGFASKLASSSYSVSGLTTSQESPQTALGLLHVAPFNLTREQCYMVRARGTESQYHYHQWEGLQFFLASVSPSQNWGPHYSCLPGLLSTGPRPTKSKRVNDTERSNCNIPPLELRGVQVAGEDQRAGTCQAPR